MKDLFPKRKRTEAPDRRPVIPVLTPEADSGLTGAQVAERVAAGFANTPVDPPGKTVKQIIAGNVFSYFNLVFFVLAGLTAAVQSWNNLMFMGVVIINMVIGIVQELRSKRTLDRLTLLNAPRATAIREGEAQKLDTAALVRDDVVVFCAGDQVYADAVLLTGACRVNEALVTGEADEIEKQPGDALLSGSFLVSGTCRARLTAVGEDSYVNRLALKAKQGGGVKQGEMMRSLSSLVKWIGVMIIPIGVLLCIKEVRWLGRSVTDGIISTVAALVGLIPEGLYLLTTITLVASILRLAKRRTLVHEMSCLETLARVDTLCVDKTGTITENRMTVERLHPLCPERYNEEDIIRILRDYTAASGDGNDTMTALREAYGGTPAQTAVMTLPFTSGKKYGGVSFHEDETYLLGAPEVLLGDRWPEYTALAEQCAAEGSRVLLLADYSGSLTDEELSGALLPLALITLRNRLRPEAAETFRFFAAQGVAIKVISGDSPVTVSRVAAEAGITGAERWVDARTLTEETMPDALERYSVFGRVTPEQKQYMVRALKRQGHTVAMTGDGVNDVLAMREADCSVAMASGSDAACQVSNIVLLRSDFSVLPEVVAEGRRVINNIQRSATLFLMKNVFHLLLSITTLIFRMPYPFAAAQLSLVSGLTTGFPAFVLAMEPNDSLVRGRFLRNVMRMALPPALTDYLLILGVLLFFRLMPLDQAMLGTVSAVTMGIVGILVIARISRPFTLLRKLLLATVCVSFAFCVLFLKELFSLTPLNSAGLLLLAVFALLAGPVLRAAYTLRDRLEKNVARKNG